MTFLDDGDRRWLPESVFAEGYEIAIAGGKRSDNPYARGWSRFAALVMPNSLAAEFDRGFMLGLTSRHNTGE